MRYIIASVKQKENIESIVCTETGVLLRKREDASLESLLEGLPKGRVAAYLGGAEAICPKSWRVQKETEKEALFRGCGMEASGVILRLDAGVTLITKDTERKGIFGSAFALEKALQLAEERTGYLRYALEVAAGLPFEEIEAYLGSLPEEKRLSYARVVEKGCCEGDADSLKIAREVIEGCLSLLAEIPEGDCPLYIEGVPMRQREKIWEHIHSAFPGRFHPHSPSFPPMLYAARKAAALFKIEPDTGFCRRFLTTYKKDTA